LYACRLAKLGHQVVGVDYSPASIAYARRTAGAEKLDCTFIERDIRQADYGEGYEAAMLIFGELNIFKPADARLILRKAQAALKPGGRLILEPHTFGAVKALGERKPTWYSSEGGLFLPSPHAVLEEYFWDLEETVTMIRYYVVDAANGDVTLHAQSFQAYTQAEYEALIEECGYTNTSFHPSLMSVPDPEQSSLLAILAEKPV
jgi:SAM-dependent methyltransferase